jgi:hypothetical protein
MVPLHSSLNIGLEVNQSFMKETNTLNAVPGSNASSANLLEGLVVARKFFGEHFFLETGGGLYRPKVTITSPDGVRSSFTCTDFGIFGGTGLFLPTSSHAGFSIRARVHNYFDQNNQTYFGVAGGFRFKME